ncbi:MAG TPA: phosphoribosylformimino-5-aminoimidazole carboxamide ribotide isomerase [Clostridiales bacterium]|nr:phosphoribosylformimino-5-aminoimidazole carboxamide ribotide isomerase [Clostridiales bacterium]
MRFRPCIDIHNGKIKQIVGGSLEDEGDSAKENFVSIKDAAYYANLYKNDNLKGGHVIMLNPIDSEYYESNYKQAKQALQAYPRGLQIGGGINDENAKEFLDLGASHVIVTSFVFKDASINYQNLEKLKSAIGKEKLVLDLSCRKKDNEYYIVTDRWQRFTDVKLNHETLDKLSDFCDEFLIHGVDVEGKSSGIEEDLVLMLGKWDELPITYAGGVATYSDIELINKLGNSKVDVTIGSSLDIFGGTMEYNKVVKMCK